MFRPFDSSKLEVDGFVGVEGVALAVFAERLLSLEVLQAVEFVCAFGSCTEPSGAFLA